MKHHVPIDVGSRVARAPLPRPQLCINVYTRERLTHVRCKALTAELHVAVSQKLSSRTLASVYIFAVEATGRARPATSMGT